MSDQTPCQGGRPGSSHPSPVNRTGHGVEQVQRVTCIGNLLTERSLDTAEQALRHPGTSNWCAVVVIAGHSAFVSLDGPVHRIGPTGVFAVYSNIRRSFRGRSLCSTASIRRTCPSRRRAPCRRRWALWR